MKLLIYNILYYTYGTRSVPISKYNLNTKLNYNDDIYLRINIISIF